jgi:aminoglycoside 3-N-acetyltransferase
MTSSFSHKKRFRRFLRRVHARLFHSISRDKLEAAIDRVAGQAKPRVIMMHSSLSNCGYIHGGAATVIEAIGARCGTLCLPTHTFSYPTGDPPIAPLYDRTRTASKVGAITNYFWRLPGAVRSINPTHSLAARGELAEQICAGHEDGDTPCGAGTPYARLLELDAAAVLFGAYRYTFYHTAEDAAGCGYLYYPEPVEFRIVDRNGAERRIRQRRQNLEVKRRFREVYPELEREGLLHLTRLGRAHLGFIPSTQAVHRFLLEQIQRDQFFLVRKGYMENAKQTAEQTSHGLLGTEGNEGNEEG